MANYSVSPDETEDTPSPDLGLNLSESDLIRLGVNEEAVSKDKVAKTSQTLIAEALQALSLEEREHVFDDIHGVDTHAEEAAAMETPSFLEKQLLFFEEELQLFKLLKQGNAELKALELAEQQDLAFVQDGRLRLAFLRTREWDATEAVRAFVGYFDLKQHLFGAALLTKYVGVVDLTSGEEKQLSQGYVQVLPNRDRAGRAVMVWLNLGQEYDSMESMSRQNFVMVPMDVETQRRGVCFISIRVEPYKFKTKSTIEVVSSLTRMTTDMPYRTTAHHSCMLKSEMPNVPLEEFVKATVSVQDKTRMRIHYGSHVEWRYALSTFGIPVQLLPLTADLKIKPKNHREYVEMLTIAASSANTIDAILLPTNRDLLLGKGKPIQQSPGNVIWSEFLDFLVMSQGDLSSPMMYTGLATQVVARIHKYRGRILSKDSGVWEVVPDELAHERIISMMRNRRFRRRHKDG